MLAIDYYHCDVNSFVVEASTVANTAVYEQEMLVDYKPVNVKSINDRHEGENRSISKRASTNWKTMAMDSGLALTRRRALKRRSSLAAVA